MQNEKSKLKIFISWSGKKSNNIATIIVEFIENFYLNNVDTFMSTYDIAGGQNGLLVIRHQLKQCHIGIFCFLEENLEAPWMMYEAGALALKDNNKSKNSESDIPDNVKPLYFGDINADLLAEHPIRANHQYFTYNNDYYKNKKQYKKLFSEIYGHHLRLTGNDFFNGRLDIEFDTKWQQFSNKIDDALHKHMIGSASALYKDLLVDKFKRAGFPTPACDPINGQMVKYKSGFETHKLYEVILGNVSKRLWMFGRKNRKFFDTINRDFFAGLNDKIDAGFDFRCLFLNPYAKNLDITKAQNTGDFTIKLKTSIITAYDMLHKNNVHATSHMLKAYDTHRQAQIIVADNVVLVSHIVIDANGLPAQLTDASFDLFKSDDPVGEHYIADLLRVWNDRSTREIDDSFVQAIRNEMNKN